MQQIQETPRGAYKRWAAALWVLWLGTSSCGDIGQPIAEFGGTVGFVLGDAPIANVSVRVLAWGPNGKLHYVARSEPSDTNGRFEIKEALPASELLFVAPVAKSGLTLRALVQGEALRAGNLRVVVSPLTEVEAGVADFWQSRGKSPPAAMVLAKAAWQQHVLGHDMAHDPSLWRRCQAIPQASPGGPREAGEMLWASFVRMAQHGGRASATNPAPWAALTRLLVEDVAADGRFDGRGQQGASLSFGSWALDEDTMRTAWARSVLQEAEAWAIRPGEGRSVWLPVADRLRASAAELFSRDARDLERVAPHLTVDERLLWCDSSGRVLLSGTVNRPVSSLWLQKADGSRQSLVAWPQGDAAAGDHWFAGEIEHVRLGESFEGQLSAFDQEGLGSWLPVRFVCSAAQESTAHSI